MKHLREQLKNREFTGIYLFTGEEKFLLDAYTNRYIESVFEGQDKMMNLDRFNQDNKDIDRIESSLETLPFFADKRMVVLEYLDLFNSKNKAKMERIMEKLKNIPETTVCMILEDKADKRSKLYKLVKDKGTFHDFTYLSEKELIQYVARELKKHGLKISSYDARHFIDTVGYELRAIAKEVHKLIDYMGADEIVTKKAIDEVCTRHLESKIFELVDSVGLKNREKALYLYQDMIALREPTTRILFMISRQLTLIYRSKLLKEKRMPGNLMAKELKVPEFVVRKLLDQGSKFSVDDLKRTMKELVELEHDFKSGRINLETGIELMILKMSQ